MNTQDRPNVLVVMCDELKATALGLYGNPVLRTPALERLADEGILYECAFTPHPLCVPARAAFWSGRYPHSTGARTNQTFLPPDGSVRHMARVWWEAGYTTGVIGKNHCFVGEDEARLGVIADGWGQRPGTTPDSAVAAARAARPSHGFAGAADSWVAPYRPEHSGTWQIAHRTVEFLEARAAEGAAGAPWGLWVSFPDPHPMFQAPEPYASRFPPERVPLPRWRPNEFADKPQRQRVFSAMMGLESVPEEDVRRVIGIYYAMTAQIDDALGYILDALVRLDLHRRTIVVFTADHGDFIGEHCLMEKGGMLYDALVRVPLLVAWPKHLPGGRRIRDLVSLVDVMPSLLWLQGLPVPHDVQGQRLPGIPWRDFGAPQLEPASRYRERAEARGFRPRLRPRAPGETTAPEAPISFAELAWAQPGAPPAARRAVFAEYGAGGPPVTLERLAHVAASWPANRRRVHMLLLEREAEGRPKMVRTQRWKYVYDPLDPDGIDELYDLETDLSELDNLAASPDPTHRAARAELRDILLDWSLTTEDSVPVPFAF
ncbi:MAG: sulfatase-like hydrolase/transferase [Chloroflexi bacterium]|nr:sulfatase-like hydrolase/transferase [Chloroflexota bacterium]